MQVSMANVELAGYRIFEQLYAGSKTLIWRGQRLSDQKPVVIKLLRAESPSFSELVQFRNQYTIAKNLKLPGVIQPYSLEPYHNTEVLVMEDFGGMSLKEYTASYLLNLSDFFPIALQIVTVLEGLYANQVIHKDIKPANLLINPDTKQVKLIDFSIASLLPRENQTIVSPTLLEGTLAYLPPEQTGRMNRGIDYRSDFYSLGVTFYELLTGQLPFTTRDPLELVYCHLAKQPIAAHKIDSDIPLMLSELIQKLMAKNAEERYQSAFGLKHDLEICWHQWKETGTIAPFELGQKDTCDRFIIPEKLYGREAEIETLLAAFERVSAGATEMMLVAGFSGIGKTAVVNEVHKSIVRDRGYFIQGKYDQFQREIPFAALVRAFRDLIGQLLTESQEQVEQWKAKILAAVGENGQVIIDIIPEVELLIGKQPSVAECDSVASQNRFKLVFQKFIRVFTSADHPIVIFLDDLQWADAASLRFIQSFMSDIEMSHLLLIGAYRDNEVNAAHPLMLTLNEIRKTGTLINSITLAPLAQTQLNCLVADTLGSSEGIASSLTQFIFARTKGHPFFSKQLLRALHEDGLITFNFEAGTWQCDLEEIRSVSLPSDVVEFVAIQLQKLPTTAQEALQLAACIGNQFDLEKLAIVHEKSPAETAADLWEAVQEGFIIPLNDAYKFYQQASETSFQTLDIPNSSPTNAEQQSVTYKFLHDRVQQAAYFLIPDDQKQATHLKIGQLLLQSISPEEREEKIFGLVNQLNLAAALIFDPTQRLELAELNLIAGQKAKNSTAYTASLRYLRTGIQLLPFDRWEIRYALTLALYENLAESAYLSTNFEYMEEIVQLVLENAKTPLDKVNAYVAKVSAYKAQSRNEEAITTGLEVLQLLDIELPVQPKPNDIGIALQKTQSALGGQSIEDLINLPVMSDPINLAAMNLLGRLLPTTYMTSPLLFSLIVLQQVNLSLQCGNCGESALAYATYAILLWNMKGDLDSCYQLGQLALKVLDRVEAKEIKCVVMYAVNTFTRHWQEHLKNTLNAFLEGYSIGLETGDLENAAFSIKEYIEGAFWLGKSLKELESEIVNTREGIAQLKQEVPLQTHDIHWQVVLNLLGDSENPCWLKGKACDEESLFLTLEQADVNQNIFYLHLHKLFLCYLFEDYPQALKHAALAGKSLNTAPAKFVFTIFSFYHALALLAAYVDADETEQQQILSQVSTHQAQLKKWAEHAPMNFSHKFHLVEAERYRVLGQHVAAIEAYDRAIILAKEHEYVNEEAIAHELAGKFYLSLGNSTIAQLHLTNAHAAYTRWGAKAKLNRLAEQYSELLNSVLSSKVDITIDDPIAPESDSSSLFTTKHTTTISTSSRILEALDLASVLKASQALSSEIQLEQLVSTLMQTVIENSGAEIGILILRQNESWMIEALATLNQSGDATLKIEALNSIPVESSHQVPITLFNYVSRMSETIVIEDATTETTFAADPYIVEHRPKSILCTSICSQGKPIGVLYLENNLTTGAFTHDRLEVLQLLTTQAAISLDNAILYRDLTAANQHLEEHRQTLEQKVAERTEELHQKNQHLQQTLQELQNTQSQLIQAEKMSGLGQMVAGIAHEINNPINFIHGNLNPANAYIRDLLELIAIYQQEYAQPTPKVQEMIEQINLEFLSVDLPKIINSMRNGSDRIRKIVLGLRNFSRLDEADMKPVDIHEGIESTLMILQHRITAKEHLPEIQIIKNYALLPRIQCYANQLNQVFMNILSNAIDALRQKKDDRAQNTEWKPIIAIHTEITNHQQNSTPHSISYVVIRIADNGTGIPEALQQRIFDPFFTTKPVGSGTGLGLSISYQIVVDKHQGQLTCHSKLGEGTEFVIEIPMEQPSMSDSEERI